MIASSKTKFVTNTLALGIIVVVTTLYLCNIGYIPEDMEGDLTTFSLVSANIVEGKDSTYAITPPRYAFLLPLWQICMALLFKCFGVSRTIVSFGSLLIGLLTIIAFYYFCQKLFPAVAIHTTALFSCSLWLFPYWLYGMGPFAFMILFVILITFFYYKLLQNNRTAYYTILVTIILGLSLFNGYVHIVLLYPILFLHNLFSNRGIIRIVNCQILCITLGSVLLYVSLVWFTSIFMYRIPLAEYYQHILTQMQVSAGSAYRSLGLLLSSTKSILQNLFYGTTSDPNTEFNLYLVLGYPLLNPIVSILFITGLIHSWIKKDNSSLLFNISLFLPLIAFTVFFEPRSRYLLLMSPCIYFLAGRGLQFLHHFAKAKQGTVYFHGFTAIIVFFSFIHLNQGFRDYYKDTCNMFRFTGFSQIGAYLQNEIPSTNRTTIIVLGDDILIPRESFLFFTRGRFADRTIRWVDFKKNLDDFKKLQGENYYFIFSAPEIEFGEHKSQVEDFLLYFPGWKPHRVFFLNDNTERSYVYKVIHTTLCSPISIKRDI